MLDPMKHNYMKKIMKLYQDGKLPPPGVALTRAWARASGRNGTDGATV